MVRKDSINLFISIIAILFASSCLQQSGAGSRKSTGASISNTPSSVSPTYGRYLTDNPIALSGKKDLAADTDLSIYLNPQPQFITYNQFLIGPCSKQNANISECFEVKANDTSSYLTEKGNRWAFPTDTSSFRQVQTFGNIRDITMRFLDWLEFSFNAGQSAPYSSAHPANLFSSSLRPFWLRQNPNQANTGKLTGYSDCDIENNAFFSPAKNEVCMGKLTVVDKVYFSQDPNITWHEVGHGLNQILLNTRNLASGSHFLEDSNLGYLFYDEAGSIGEGLSDYWSFVMNSRTHFAEWALGRFLQASRPLTEADNLHAAGISTDFSGRLSYPTYLNYDPNEPETRYEDVHYAGQIFSHFLTALTFDIRDHCHYDLTSATRYVMHLIMETFAELGDQTSKGFDGAPEDRVNLTQNASLEWIRVANPINYRRFMQTFGKFHLLNLGQNGQCHGGNYSQDRYDQLVDSYGLLLYRTYNTNGNGILYGNAAGNISVLDTNRVKTVLVNKNHIQIDSREGKPEAFVIDDQIDIIKAMDALKDGGQIPGISTQIDENFGYNNGNARISPGEVVGLVLNIYNNSNSTIAGLQILANDWDHAKNGAPCNNFEDNWPLSSQGAADLSSGEGVQGGCNYITRTNATNSTLEPNESLAPICFVELSDSEASKWYSQDELMRRIGLEAQQCLGGSNQTKDCFIRSLKGVDQAFYSQLAPKSTWAETLAQNNGVPTFNFNNVLFFEVSPWIPPGTIFNCRFRARFSNCDDCWHNSTQGGDDYKDFEYSGNRPFKIINFQFTVVD